jgi:hypothetical protein
LWKVAKLCALAGFPPWHTSLLPFWKSVLFTPLTPHHKFSEVFVPPSMSITCKLFCNLPTLGKYGTNNNFHTKIIAFKFFKSCFLNRTWALHGWCSYEVFIQITPPRHIFQQKPTMNKKNPN